MHQMQRSETEKSEKDSVMQRGRANRNIPAANNQRPEAIIQRFKTNPNSLTHSDFMQLQRTIGNKAVTQLMRSAHKSSTDEAVQKKANKTGLPDKLKTGIESLSGISMENVRVRYNSDKPAGVGALAYTQGKDIHVAPGQEKHLPHEAWHVVQQAQGRVRPTMQLKGIALNDNVGLEKEADDMGKRVSGYSRPVQLKKNEIPHANVIQRVLDNPALQEQVVEIYNEVMEVPGVHKESVLIETRGLEQHLIKKDDAEYGEVQRLGGLFGCWQCGKTMASGKGANWIADHVPPVSLNPRVLKAIVDKGYISEDLGKGVKWILKPHCRDCSEKQASIVRELNGLASEAEIKKKVEEYKAYLVGNEDYDTESKVTDKKNTSQSPRWKADDEGLRCHCCGETTVTSAQTKYVADHYPPREFNTHYAKSLFRKAGLPEVKPQFRPQCYICSSQQGSLTSLSKKLLKIAGQVGIQAYK